jgi:AcrR family transcriptional regulator
MHTPPATAPRSVAASPSSRPAAGADRRDSLLDTAAEMVASGNVEAVSMDTVAKAAGVSRALVYKHFANRNDLLSSLYARESGMLHAQLTAAVQAEHDLEGMLGALVRGALAAQASRGATLAALSAGGGRPSTHRTVQRRRDGQTLGFFTRQAVAEYDVGELDARTGLAVVLGSLPTVLARWRLRPTDDTARLLEATYVAMAIGGIKELARRRGGRAPTTPGLGAS